MEDNKNCQITGEKILIEDRKRLTLSSVKSVDAFNENYLKLFVSCSSVEITGSKIKITSFNDASGNLTAEGVFTSIKFGGKKVPFVKRLFK